MTPELQEGVGLAIGACVAVSLTTVVLVLVYIYTRHPVERSLSRELWGKVLKK